MKTTTKIVIGITAATVVALAIYKTRRRNTCKMLNEVSNEGYETAPDVLFPNKGKRGAKQHYGPVLPE
jgi:hypothetical protein